MSSSEQNPPTLLLTAQQKAYAREYAPTFVREQLAAILSTTPIDEEEVKRLLCDIYGTAKLAPPTIRWFDSPASFVQECLRVPSNKHGEYFYLSTYEIHSWLLHWRWKRTDCPRILWTDIASNIDDDLKCINDVTAHVRENVKNKSWAHVREYIISRCEKEPPWGRQRWDRLVEFYISDSVRVYKQAHTLACIRFLYEVLERFPEPHLLDVLARIDDMIENKCLNVMRFNELVSGYRLSHKEAWLVRKPVLLERDEQGRWHNASGPCLWYRDGWGWYAWHGVRVPEWIILYPERLTKWDWIRQRNVEVRRAIQERLGNERFIEMVGGKLIDTGRRGKLIEIKLGRRDPERVARFVQVQDSSTERQYYLRVPPSITRADEAIAWTFGLNARDYQPDQET